MSSWNWRPSHKHEFCVYYCNLTDVVWQKCNNIIKLYFGNWTQLLAWQECISLSCIWLNCWWMSCFAYACALIATWLLSGYQYETWRNGGGGGEETLFSMMLQKKHRSEVTRKDRILKGENRSFDGLNKITAWILIMRCLHHYGEENIQYFGPLPRGTGILGSVHFRKNN